MIEVATTDSNLLLNYYPERDDGGWLTDKLKRADGHTFKRTFTVKSQHLLEHLSADEDSGPVWSFAIGIVDGEYWRVDKNVLGIKDDLLISRNIKPTIMCFVAIRDISIFAKIDDMIDEPIVIGGQKNKAIPKAEFERVLKEFPTTTELFRYTNLRISHLLAEHFETMTDAEHDFVKFQQKRRGVNLNKISKIDPAVKIVNQFDLDKYLFLKNQLTEMLNSSEKYHETEWQKKFANLFLLIYPQYVAVLQNVAVNEYYTKDTATQRKFDLVLVSANGCLDLMEIKIPSTPMVSRSLVRDNHYPRRELSAAIIQAEKYIFYLNKAGKKIEDELTKKYPKQLPAALKIKVTNPKTIILSGRDIDFSQSQKDDFEFIKRKYSNVMDIMTYDDLLRRIDNVISTLKERV